MSDRIEDKSINQNDFAESRYIYDVKLIDESVEVSGARTELERQQAIFAMNNIDKPLVISGQLGACDFLKYIEQELKDKCLWRVEYSLGYQSFPEPCPESPEQIKCKNERY